MVNLGVFLFVPKQVAAFIWWNRSLVPLESLSYYHPPHHAILHHTCIESESSHTFKTLGGMAACHILAQGLMGLI
jgi:hypothetical protein